MLVMSRRPIIKIEKDALDWAMDIVGILCLIGLIVIPFIYYSELPSEIPSHYNGSGEPDAYSSKAVIWTLPIVGTLLFFMLKMLTPYPDKFNYPIQITQQNARTVYGYGVKTLNWMSTAIAGVCLYLTHSTILIGLGQAENLGSLFLPVFVIILFGPVIYFLYKTYLAR